MTVVLDTIIDEVNKLIGASDFEGLDAWLRKVPMHDAEQAELIALARAAAPVRSKLPAWIQFVKDCAAAIDAHGGDSRLVLKGLLA
jgi:hypothetical protein